MERTEVGGGGGGGIYSVKREPVFHSNSKELFFFKSWLQSEGGNGTEFWKQTHCLN